MAEFVSDCPRCGAQNITMDCYSSVCVGTRYRWQNVLEIFAVCRRCHVSSIQLVEQKNSDEDSHSLCAMNNALLTYKGSLNDVVKFVRFITHRDNHNYEPPEYLPPRIKAIIDEGNSCLASQCFNAAGAMYRLALDIYTKDLLPAEGEPNTKIRRSLGLRIEWLFGNGVLPLDLKALAECLQQDGNDGAHDGTLSKDDAEDLQDFAFELLRRLITEPERLRLAEERRLARREGSQR